jgi:hypothetical protein
MSDQAASPVKMKGAVRRAESICAVVGGARVKERGGDECKKERQNNGKVREREEGIEGRLRDSVLGR